MAKVAVVRARQEAIDGGQCASFLTRHIFLLPATLRPGHDTKQSVSNNSLRKCATSKFKIYFQICVLGSIALSMGEIRTSHVPCRMPYHGPASTLRGTICGEALVLGTNC
jgi:hypothetical protein